MCKKNILRVKNVRFATFSYSATHTIFSLTFQLGQRRKIWRRKLIYTNKPVSFKIISVQLRTAVLFSLA